MARPLKNFSTQELVDELERRYDWIYLTAKEPTREEDKEEVTLGYRRTEPLADHDKALLELVLWVRGKVMDYLSWEAKRSSVEKSKAAFSSCRDDLVGMIQEAKSYDEIQDCFKKMSELSSRVDPLEKIAGSQKSVGESVDEAMDRQKVLNQELGWPKGYEPLVFQPVGASGEPLGAGVSCGYLSAEQIYAVVRKDCKDWNAKHVVLKNCGLGLSLDRELFIETLLREYPEIGRK